MVKVKEEYLITYDSEQGNEFLVKQPRKQMVFQQGNTGLYYHNVRNCALVMVNTAQQNLQGYTKQEYEAAKIERERLAMVGNPSVSMKHYKNMVHSGMIKNCPISPADIITANQIFGPDVAYLRGKSVRQSPELVRTDYVKIPQEILKRNKEIMLVADIILVSRFGFMISISHGMKFTTIEYQPNRTKANLLSSLGKIFKLYEMRF